MIIDCHGHFTTAPPQLGQWRDRQVAAVADPTIAPDPDDLVISDDELREAIAANQLRLMDERGSDLTVFSPRASFMAHHIGDFAVSSTWARICNDLVHRVSTLFPDTLFPDRFAMGAMLPQSPGVDPATCLPELRRTVEELGAVTINLNPDPSGGKWTAPPLTDRSWYPIYEAMVEYDIPAMVHVSTSCNPAFHTTGAHYLNADTTAFMQLLQGDLFADFPSLKLVIPHGGGAVPYHWGRFRGLAMALDKPDPRALLDNVFFDTCVYHQPAGKRCLPAWRRASGSGWCPGSPARWPSRRPAASRSPTAGSATLSPSSPVTSRRARRSWRRSSLWVAPSWC